jgi:hypothetical protein
MDCVAQITEETPSFKREAECQQVVVADAEARAVNRRVLRMRAIRSSVTTRNGHTLWL